MVARSFWLILAVALTVAPVKAEPIKIAYSGVSAAGTPLWLAKEEGIFTKHGLEADLDRKSTRLNSSHLVISYAVFCLKKKKTPDRRGGPTGQPGRAHLQSSTDVSARAGS